MRNLYKTTVRRPVLRSFSIGGSLSTLKILLWRRRIANIALIFTLIGVFLSSDLLYARGALRLPLCFQNKELRNRVEELLPTEFDEVYYKGIIGEIVENAVRRLERYLDKSYARGVIFDYDQKSRVRIVKPGTIHKIARAIRCNYELIPLLFLKLNQGLEKQGLNQFLLPFEYKVGPEFVQEKLTIYKFFQKNQTGT